MPQHAEKKILPYSQAQVFALVADVESYAKFLPWCQGVRVQSHTTENITADLLIGYKVLREKYTSKVHFLPHEHIKVEYLNGPFKHLHNEWRFRALENGHCEIDFYIDFEFGNKVLQGLISGLFFEVVKRMVGAFETEAHRRYGRRASDKLL
jgi:coenzyme Q-binding protein COQ10